MTEGKLRFGHKILELYVATYMLYAIVFSLTA